MNEQPNPGVVPIPTLEDITARVTLPSVAVPGQPAGETLQVKLKRFVDGDMAVPSATTKPDGSPRFTMPVPPRFAENDMGVAYMVRHELIHDGFERPMREVIDAHLRPLDVFIDVGAHWGLMSFSAATRYPGNVHVIAIEAHPENAGRLFKGVQINKLQNDIEVVAAAAGDKQDLVPLAFNTTMGHSVIEGPARTSEGGKLFVPMLTVDQILAQRPHLAQRNVILKIDVEGYEPEVIKGCKELLASGRVKLIMWEKGFDQRIAERRKAYNEMTRELSAAGFGHFTFPWPEWGGILVPDVPIALSYNIYSFHRSEARLPHYMMRFSAYPPFNLALKLGRDGNFDEGMTSHCMRLKATDGARWAEYRTMTPDAIERARAVAPYFKSGDKILDLGCGAMAVRRVLPEKCRYTPADLVGRASDCYLIDLNQAYSFVDELFPAAPTVDGRFEWVTLLETLEFVHDIPRVFERARKSSGGLLFTYRTVESAPGTPLDPATVKERRRAGYFTDFSAGQIEAMARGKGWTIEERKSVAGSTLFICH
jgi:FkbM family methyltransferase